MNEHPCGYVYDGKAIDRFVASSPMHCETGPLESGAGKDVFLFEVERMLTGSVRPPHAQTIGDCVSQGFTGAAEDLQFVQMATRPGNEFRPLSTELVYGAARVQVGKGGLGNQDGAVVAWAFEAGQKLGMLARGVYGPYDLTSYRADLARRWGTPGVGAPPELLAEAKSHLVLKCNLLTGANLYEQARDVIANGGAVVTGSNTLFASVRDKDGFVRPQGRAGHCTYYRGVSDNSRRPGIVYQASWGKDYPVGGEATVTLPSGREVTLPPGAFFVDADVFERMHGASGSEVWALWAEDGWLAPDDHAKFVFA